MLSKIWKINERSKQNFLCIEQKRTKNINVEIYRAKIIGFVNKNGKDTKKESKDMEQRQL